jgi:UBA-like domain/Putative zinc finger in N-recognin (UBR box)/Ubiquitin family
VSLPQLQFSSIAVRQHSRNSTDSDRQSGADSPSLSSASPFPSQAPLLLALDVESQSHCDAVKAQVADALNTSSKRIVLLFRGRIMQHTDTLQGLGIRPGSYVIAIVRPRHAGYVSEASASPQRTRLLQLFDRLFLLIQPFMIQPLVEAGFSRRRAVKALLLNLMSGTAALKWLSSHRNDDNADSPLTPRQLYDTAIRMGLATRFSISSDITTCISKRICTHARTGNKYSSQMYRFCYTCGLHANKAVCLSCALVCHVGHDLSEPEYARNFCCDCGAGRGPVPCHARGNAADGNSSASDKPEKKRSRANYAFEHSPLPQPEVEPLQDIHALGSHVVEREVTVIVPSLSTQAARALCSLLNTCAPPSSDTEDSKDGIALLCDSATWNVWVRSLASHLMQPDMTIRMMELLSASVGHSAGAGAYIQVHNNVEFSIPRVLDWSMRYVEQVTDEASHGSDDDEKRSHTVSLRKQLSCLCSTLSFLTNITSHSNGGAMMVTHHISLLRHPLFPSLIPLLDLRLRELECELLTNLVCGCVENPERTRPLQSDILRHCLAVLSHRHENFVSFTRIGDLLKLILYMLKTLPVLRLDFVSLQGRREVATMADVRHAGIGSICLSILELEMDGNLAQSLTAIANSRVASFAASRSASNSGTSTGSNSDAQSANASGDAVSIS